MAESTKYQPINGTTLISELGTVFSVHKKTRTTTMAFAYGFVFVFVAFSVFFAFSPSSNSSSPWFTNIFTITPSSGNGTSTFSANSSFYSYFFPNSSQLVHQNQTQKQNFTQVDSNHRSDKFPVQTPELKKPILDVKNQSTGGVLNLNQTKIDAPKIPSNGTEGLKQNQTKNADLKPSSGEGLKQNQTKNADLNPKTPAPKNSTPSEEKKSGKDQKGNKVEKGEISNYTASLMKKHGSNNGTQSGVSDTIASLTECDLFDGNWVRDDSYPLYKPGSCSLIDPQFNCFINGRPDQIYQHLKWKPKGCSLPRLNAKHMLELLRGKRLVFVGDSLNRNMWESLVCILKTAVKDESKVYEASGRHHFRTEASYSFIFKDYNCTVEFFVSPFLVQEWDLAEKNGSTKETLRLDLIGRSADKYKDADFIIFNTGHWWTHDKTSKGKDYYQEGSHVYGELNVIEAFRKALTTWARWVDARVNPEKSMVFFRGYSASHFSGGRWNSGGQCDSETEPIKNETYLSPYPPKMKVLESVLKGMKTHVTYLNITRITDYRKDGHPSVYRKQHLSEEERKSPLLFQDCSHWCLPGVPDVWNELLYAEIIIRQQKRA